ncbi:hypothetical protein C0992_007595 [Termitomyces sp. T32_za158]|nr:hypothetical protein C0992_007595 [Termitomyces sp. T32_za158]
MQEAVDIMTRYEELRSQVGDTPLAIAKAWHRLEALEQFEYRDALYEFCVSSDRDLNAAWVDAQGERSGFAVLYEQGFQKEFASAVRTLRIYSPLRDRDGALAFQIGMLTNALPNLINLRNVHISAGVEDILVNGRQVESLSLRCSLEGATPQQFRVTHFAYGVVLPFLRNFSFSVTGVHRRVCDRDLFSADESVQRAVGFDAAVWGVLPSLVNLPNLKIAYLPDVPGAVDSQK